MKDKCPLSTISPSIPLLSHTAPRQNNSVQADDILDLSEKLKQLTIQGDKPSGTTLIFDIKNFIGKRITTTPKSKFVSKIVSIINSPSFKMGPLPWKLQRNQESAIYNSMLIQKENFNINAVIQSHPYSVHHTGYEFRNPSILEPFLQYHPRWSRLKEFIANGVSYHPEEISDTDRLQDIKFMLDRGNHPSASKKPGDSELSKAYDKETKYGWLIPISPSIIECIPDACVTPLGVASQTTLNDHNEVVPKYRVIHDCTFSGPSNKSINERIDKDLLEPSKVVSVSKEYFIPYMKRDYDILHNQYS